MDPGVTSVAVQRYLDELACLDGDLAAEPIIKDLLARSVDRLHLLCARLLYRNYPRLMRGPLNLRSEELLSAVVERLIRAMRQVRPRTVRHFFALANQHMRWELNDLARHLDEQASAIELRESAVVAPVNASGSQAGPNMRRILDAIEALPEEEREVFHLVRLQGMSKPEAAGVIGVSEKTVSRRLARGLLILTGALGDIQAQSPPRPERP